MGKTIQLSYIVKLEIEGKVILGDLFSLSRGASKIDYSVEQNLQRSRDL